MNPSENDITVQLQQVRAQVKRRITGRKRSQKVVAGAAIAAIASGATWSMANAGSDLLYFESLVSVDAVQEYSQCLSKHYPEVRIATDKEKKEFLADYSLPEGKFTVIRVFYYDVNQPAQAAQAAECERVRGDLRDE